MAVVWRRPHALKGDARSPIARSKRGGGYAHRSALVSCSSSSKQPRLERHQIPISRLELTFQVIIPRVSVPGSRSDPSLTMLIRRLAVALAAFVALADAQDVTPTSGEAANRT